MSDVGGGDGGREVVDVGPAHGVTPAFRLDYCRRWWGSRASPVHASPLHLLSNEPVAEPRDISDVPFSVADMQGALLALADILFEHAAFNRAPVNSRHRGGHAAPRQAGGRQLPTVVRTEDLWMWSLIVDAVEKSTWVQQSILLLLIGFSIVSWALILMKMRALRAAKGNNERFLTLFNASETIGEFTPPASRGRRPWRRSSTRPSIRWRRPATRASGTSSWRRRSCTRR